MATQLQTPQFILDQLVTTMNHHDLEGFLECFDIDYRSEQPAHPDRQFGGKDQVRRNWAGIFSKDRQFGGKDQVRKNWARIFSGVPDFRAELVRAAVADSVIWAEWNWQGTRADEFMFHLRGVTIFEVSSGRIIWGHLYMEPVETGGVGIDASLKAIAEGKR